jgi:hypothetical protein
MLLALMVACGVRPPAAQAGWASIRASNHTERKVEPARHEPERVLDRRRQDIEAERRHAFYWSGFHPGVTLTALPGQCMQTSVGAVGYYYYDGVYFQPTTTSSYVVVAPPLGAVVPELPEGAEPIIIDSTTWYYGAGAFYVQQQNGFAVVAAPPGVTVTGLPPGAAPVVINGTMYYVAGAAYYMPVMQGGVTVYVTARP